MDDKRGEIFDICNGRYIDIDTGNERRYNDGKLACLRLNDGKEYYV